MVYEFDVHLVTQGRATTATLARRYSAALREHGDLCAKGLADRPGQVPSHPRRGQLATATPRYDHAMPQPASHAAAMTVCRTPLVLIAVGWPARAAPAQLLLRCCRPWCAARLARSVRPARVAAV